MLVPGGHTRTIVLHNHVFWPCFQCPSVLQQELKRWMSSTTSRLSSKINGKGNVSAFLTGCFSGNYSFNYWTLKSLLALNGHSLSLNKISCPTFACFKLHPKHSLQFMLLQYLKRVQASFESVYSCGYCIHTALVSAETAVVGLVRHQ